MKKSFGLAALVAMAGTSPAFAQSSVTLYGSADGGINYVSGQNGAKYALASGIREGSRFGFKGHEDLGGGWRALFVLENRYELDTGATSNRPASGAQVPDRLNSAAALGLPAPTQPLVSSVAASIGGTIGVNLANRLFDRQAYVALVTPVGAVVLGRQYTPAFEMFYLYDAMQTDTSLSAGQVVALPTAVDIRRDNAVAYRIKKDGYTGTLAYSFGEQAGSNAASRYLGANFYYDGSGWGAGVAYADNKNSLGQDALRNIILGAYVDVGPGRLSTLLVSAKDDNPEAVVGIRAALAPFGVPGVLVGNAYQTALQQDLRVYHLGYRITSSPHTITVAATHVTDRLREDTDITSYGAVYSYSFSKRTDLNFVLTRFVNDRNAQTAPGGGGFFGGVTSSAGRDATNVALGLRHQF